MLIGSKITVFRESTILGDFEYATSDNNKCLNSSQREHFNLIAIKNSLTEYGFAVIDFMNVNQVIATLVPEETKTVDGIDFHIKRYILDNHIFKEIDFVDQGETFHFTEKVKALTLDDFQEMMTEAGIYLLDTFGRFKKGKCF